MRANLIRKLQSSRYKISRMTKNSWVDQKELLVARNKRWYQKIYLRIYEMPTKQSIIHEESGKTLSVGNTRRTMERY